MRGSGPTQNRRAVYAIVACLVLIVGAGVFTPVLLPYWQPPEPAADRARPAAQAADHLGIIVVYDHGVSSCRRIAFDNITGSLNELGHGPCGAGIDDPAARVQARVGSLRDSFTKR